MRRELIQACNSRMHLIQDAKGGSQVSSRAQPPRRQARHWQCRQRMGRCRQQLLASRSRRFGSAAPPPRRRRPRSARGRQPRGTECDQRSARRLRRCGSNCPAASQSVLAVQLVGWAALVLQILLENYQSMQDASSSASQNFMVISYGDCTCSHRRRHSTPRLGLGLEFDEHVGPRPAVRRFAPLRRSALGVPGIISPSCDCSGSTGNQRRRQRPPLLFISSFRRCSSPVPSFNGTVSPCW